MKKFLGLLAIIMLVAGFQLGCDTPEQPGGGDYEQQQQQQEQDYGGSGGQEGGGGASGF
ncbi:MAG: hypothetical protein ACLFPI_06390 [Desulfobacterales bacterium]